MKSVTKYTDNTANGGGNQASYITATTDYLWLLAEFEVQGARTYANSYEQNYQAQYQYFKSGNSKVAYKYNATGTAVYWWLRSAYYSTAQLFLSCGHGWLGPLSLCETIRWRCCPALLSNPPQCIQDLSRPRQWAGSPIGEPNGRGGISSGGAKRRREFL